MTILSAPLLGLFIGKAEQRWEGKAPSAIGKKPVSHPLDLAIDGFVEDNQADLAVHGGPDKALHFYPADHYAHWQKELPEKPYIFTPGGFGENLSSAGITEEKVCIGDVFELGDTRLQISQGRQPCWKLNMHLDEKSMVARFQKSGFTGWYFRVLQTGTVTPGDTLSLIDRPCPDWVLNKVIYARFDPKLDPGLARSLSELPELAENWRNAFAKKADKDFKEDTRARTEG